MAARKPKTPPAPPTEQEKRQAAEDRERKTSSRLPLIGEGWNRGVDITTPLARTSSCTACPLHVGVTTVCMPPRSLGEPKGGVLVVQSAPTQADDKEGMIAQNGLTDKVITAVTSHHAGPLHITNALGCASSPPFEDETVAACRPYLTSDILALAPDRIIAIGDAAAKALFGHKVQAMGMRRSWGHVMGIPVFVIMGPGITVHNRIAEGWWKQDIKWSCTATVEPLTEGTVHVLKTGQEVTDWVQTIPMGQQVEVDIEYRGDYWHGDFELLCLGACVDPANPVVITGAAAHQGKAALKEWLEDPRYFKAGHNFKSDRHGIWRSLGIDVKGVSVDTLNWARMRESDNPAGLKALAWNVGWGGYAGDAIEEAEDQEKTKAGKDYGKIEPDVLHRYNARDVVVTRRVREWLQPQMARFAGTWQGLARPAQHALGHVERWGALLSADNVRTYDRWLHERLERTDASLRALPGLPPEFNPASPLQVSKHLFQTMGMMPDPKWKNASGYSVGKEVLEALKDEHPIIPILQAHSNYRTQIKNYGNKMVAHIGYDGRVHSSYRIVRSGRLGSAAPNLQNICAPGVKPGDKGYAELQAEDEGIWARGCWVASPGHLLVNLDYAQAELRVAAMLSEDEVMGAAFETGYDFHRMTASAAFGVAPQDVTAEQRTAAKGINFALTFGMDEFGLAATAGLTVVKAKELLDALLSKYVKFAAWRKLQIATAERTGESFVRWAPPGSGIEWTHRRNIWQIGEKGLDKRGKGEKKHAINVALNNPIQNMANCFSLASLTEVVRWILDEDIPARLVITVHDSLVLEAREDIAEEVGHQVAKIMTQWPSGCVKLKADLEIGPDWGHLTKVGK